MVPLNAFGACECRVKQRHAFDAAARDAQIARKRIDAVEGKRLERRFGTRLSDLLG